MNKFDFATTPKTLSFCDRVAKRMAEIFSISEEEAVARISREWCNRDFVDDFYDFRLHEEVDYWARFIFYESGVLWWVEGAVLKPKPKPA